MPTDDIDSITTKLASLELEQQKELDSVIAKHRSQKRQLLQVLSITEHQQPKPPSPKPVAPPVLSLNKFPLQRGDTVEIRSTASIG